MKVLKYSRQRESIKASLMCRHDHPTADALYASIREEFPNISLGTVYRNLNLLVETGERRGCAGVSAGSAAGTEPITSMETPMNTIILCAGSAAGFMICSLRPQQR